jgi:phage N-6-adenine-methyltransferase
MTKTALATKVRLVELEAVIERGIGTFVEVGNALREIRNDGLYKQQGYSKFDDYCKERWGWQRRHAYRLMDAAAVSELVSPMGHIPNERQARELTPLLDEPGAVEEAYAEALEKSNGQPTAADIRSVVRPEMKVHYSSDEVDWHTPPEVIEAVVNVLGTIDLDPCSNTGHANVPAAQHFTTENDGLAQSWTGKVYMNPPYGKGIGAWVEKLAESHETGDVPEAIALLPARTDTVWLRRLRDYPRCFVSGRLKFSNADQGAPFPSVAVYLGKDVDLFTAAFAPLGDTYVRYEP